MSLSTLPGPRQRRALRHLGPDPDVPGRAGRDPSDKISGQLETTKLERSETSPAVGNAEPG